MKILLVDDSKTMRTIQKSVLAQLGHTDIEEAADGRDAIEKLHHFHPDLLLVDWNMPNMDGLSFVRHYRATGSKQPIIMVSTESDNAKVADAFNAGVDNYVLKPFTPDILSQRIRETLAKAA